MMNLRSRRHKVTEKTARQFYKTIRTSIFITALSMPLISTAEEPAKPPAITQLQAEKQVLLGQNMEEGDIAKQNSWKEKERKSNEQILTIFGVIIGWAILAGVITYLHKRLIEGGEEKMKRKKPKLDDLREQYKGKLWELRERLTKLERPYCIGEDEKTGGEIYKVPESEKEKVRKELGEIEKAGYDLLHEMDKRDKRLRRTDSWKYPSRMFQRSIGVARHLLLGESMPPYY